MLEVNFVTLGKRTFRDDVRKTKVTTIEETSYGRGRTIQGGRGKRSSKGRSSFSKIGRLRCNSVADDERRRRRRGASERYVCRVAREGGREGGAAHFHSLASAWTFFPRFDRVRYSRVGARFFHYSHVVNKMRRRMREIIAGHRFFSFPSSSSFPSPRVESGRQAFFDNATVPLSYGR